MPTTSKLKAYLNRPNNINRRRALEEMLPFIQEAYQNVSLNNTVIGAEQTWPEIQRVFSEQYSELISQLSMLEYFRLFTLFDYLSDTGADATQHMPHGDFCQAVAQIIGLATPHLAKKSIPGFVTTTNHHIEQFIRWGTKQCRQEIVHATHDLAQQLTACRDNFIHSYTQKKDANEDENMIGYVLTYRDKIEMTPYLPTKRNLN
ncbi:hypothetical protein Psal006b_02357 [Piscirickettsia salmonis]|uniref:Uncharacterized protein n=1 Tax=Piscirickettsia salmonis TaxID=1238 RepID=A0A1L6TAB8_PISSA|nr:hypothetical protein [Piscirickettsia salmonis]AKP73322.1 hypothetical protein PSLF89_1391 [Piscirickettsia salmonis LF-89 = ATCC VR-1361]ALB22033.1 hypothetical protein KU39_850 [Piscirickettsia salmonis]ALY02172.1 hypothetical protein AWE47_04315 [Piscirickettsia salmonis]AMA41686.1 hypothetical protein AWJ11_04310 [Piscirickettsia salmonis]AOS34168.1 hypothetical protein AVM72_01545 [Piscirickettsia salmonis]